MVDVIRLRGIIAERGESQASTARAIKMPVKTFYRRMQRRIFGSDEIEKLIDFLDIDEPVPIFFGGE